MNPVSVYGDEALQIFAVKKWRTRLLQRRTELEDNSGSRRLANSDLTQGIAELIRERPFFMQKMMQTSQGLERDKSQNSSRETRDQKVSSSMGSGPARLKHESLSSRHATSAS
jgi:hypothetical protein